MKPFCALTFLAFGLALAGCQQQPDMVAKAEAKTPVAALNADNPVVVELYQSQGCSSCPPANAAVNAIADQPGVIALSFAVTYWDRLGWRDIFADKAYTQRQYNYAHAFGNPNVYTPQIVINGKTAITGLKPGELAKSMKASGPLSAGPSIRTEANVVKVGKGAGSANVWLVRYDPKTIHVGIRSGENDGRNLPHKNIVRSLVKLGEWRGAPISFELPNAAQKNLKTAILVQRKLGGVVIAAKII